MNILDWVAKAGGIEILRPTTLATTLWMTYDAYHWAALFAVESARSGTDISLIIAAVIAPISILQGYVFNQFVAYK